jgi:hypothetical protein
MAAERRRAIVGKMISKMISAGVGARARSVDELHLIHS